MAEIEKQFTRLEAGVGSLKRVQTALKRYRASVLKAACEGRLVPTEAELARRESRSYESATTLLARILRDRAGTANRKLKSPVVPEARRLPLSRGLDIRDLRSVVALDHKGLIAELAGL